MAHDDKSQRDRSDEEPRRQGDVLGLGGAAIPKSSTDTNTEFDEESIARRHSRALAEDDDKQRDETAFRHGSGATGIDMGAGGSGTDVE